MILAGPASQRLFAQGNQLADPAARVTSKGYAARDTSGKLSPWTFERRAVGDEDILIDIQFSGICHSDIHQLRGDWGPQKYPQVPGHEIAGVVAAVGKNVTRFKVGDHAGVGCMVDSCGTCESCKHGEEQHCETGGTFFTYGYPDKTSPTGITQGRLRQQHRRERALCDSFTENQGTALHLSGVFRRHKRLVIEYCAENKIYPEIQLIKASEVDETWEKVINKKARYRYVIDAATI